MTSKEILDQIKSVFATEWKIREGRQVPSDSNVQLGNDAVLIEATVLYADMAESTSLVDGFKNWFAAEIYKAYLLGACRVISNHGGQITAFDGDRVMAVFMGDSKNTSAVKSALQINYLVRQINTLIKVTYPNTSYVLKHTVGVDTSQLFVAKTGLRNSNDLVWVGRAANYAAKLSALGESDYPTHITEDVFNKLRQDAKVGGEPPQSMWEKVTWPEKGITVYRSKWWWEF